MPASSLWYRRLSRSCKSPVSPAVFSSVLPAAGLCTKSFPVHARHDRTQDYTNKNIVSYTYFVVIEHVCRSFLRTQVSTRLPRRWSSFAIRQ